MIIFKPDTESILGYRLSFGGVETATQEENVDGMMVPVPLGPDLASDMGTVEGCLRSECDLISQPQPGPMGMTCP